METKICKKCNIIKDISNFGVNNTRKDKHQSNCRDCMSIINKGIYKNIRSTEEGIKKHRDSNNLSHKVKRDRFYTVIKEYMNSDIFICSRCGYSYTTMRPFDWHHINPNEKKYEISSMIRHTKDKIINELNKCILLCSNCHRLEHEND